MTFTKEQQAFIEQIAWKVGGAMRDSLEDSIAQQIRIHAAECPTQKALGQARAGLSVGARLVLIIAGTVAFLMNTALSVWAVLHTK